MSEDIRLPIVVYTKNNCQPCRLTKDTLRRRGFRYVEHNVEEEPDAYERVKAMGYQQVPVVVVPFDYQVDERHWSGLQPSLLKSIR